MDALCGTPLYGLREDKKAWEVTRDGLRQAMLYIYDSGPIAPR
jgi:hypothetical protein